MTAHISSQHLATRGLLDAPEGPLTTDRSSQSRHPTEVQIAQRRGKYSAFPPRQDACKHPEWVSTGVVESHSDEREGSLWWTTGQSVAREHTMGDREGATHASSAASRSSFRDSLTMSMGFPESESESLSPSSMEPAGAAGDNEPKRCGRGYKPGRVDEAPESTSMQRPGVGEMW